MLPDFNIHGVVPPIHPSEPGHSLNRSPYKTDIYTFCQRFGGTPERRAILIGLLDLRRELQGLGIIEGFQWLDGSFVEDVEILRMRPPKDIDVVTFYPFGDAQMQIDRTQRAPALFNHVMVKNTYRVDHYMVPTDGDVDRNYHSVAYWYSMWSRQRDTDRWKGFCSVPIQSSDEQARIWLSQDANNEGCAP